MKYKTLFLLAILSSIPSTTSAKNPLSGVYIGCVTSLDVDVPMITTFKSETSGVFEYLEAELVKGTMKNLKHDKKDQIRFKWTDKYGSGTVDFKPNSDGSKFTGEWVSYARPDEIGRWDGTKTNKDVNLENVTCDQRGFRYVE